MDKCRWSSDLLIKLFLYIFAILHIYLNVPVGCDWKRLKILHLSKTPSERYKNIKRFLRNDAIFKGCTFFYKKILLHVTHASIKVL